MLDRGAVMVSTAFNAEVRWQEVGSIPTSSTFCEFCVMVGAGRRP